VGAIGIIAGLLLAVYVWQECYFCGERAPVETGSISEGQDARPINVIGAGPEPANSDTAKTPSSDADIDVHSATDIPADLLLLVEVAKRSGPTDKRVDAVRRIANSGDFRLLSVLLDITEDLDADVRYTAISLLGRFPASETIERLAPIALTNSDPVARAAAVSALSYMGDEIASETLAGVAVNSQESDTTRIQALYALDATATQEAVKMLQPLFDNSNPDIAAAALLAAARHSPVDRTEQIVIAAQAPSLDDYLQLRLIQLLEEQVGQSIANESDSAEVRRLRVENWWQSRMQDEGN
jgi:HEAT repeat protein